jgi:DNA invertase Pin-like site-specific DNA recombinase
VSTIFEERQPARSDGRTELQKVLLVLGEGDALVVTRLDRLGSLPARPCQHRP